MRIVIELCLDHRASRSLPAAEKFKTHRSSLDRVQRSYENSHVAEASLGLHRDVAHHQPENATLFGGELPTPQPPLLSFLGARQHGSYT